MKTFIITYNPAKWPEKEIQQLINQLENGEKFVERWKFGSPKKCQKGDRVFLSRVGAKKPGLIGSGHIASLPYQDKNFEHPEKISWYVDIRFDFLAPTPDTIIIDHNELEKLLNVKKRAFTPQKSGVSFKGDLIQLENIWESKTGELSFRYAEEIPSNEENEYYEGAKQRVTINKYERDVTARNECIRIYGYTCKVCNFDFEKTYGKLGKNYIHVHHLIPLCDIGEHYAVNPRDDLIPVCPNCHAMLHKSNAPHDINELTKLLNFHRK